MATVLMKANTTMPASVLMALFVLPENPSSSTSEKTSTTAAPNRTRRLYGSIPETRFRMAKMRLQSIRKNTIASIYAPTVLIRV